MMELEGVPEVVSTREDMENARVVLRVEMM
jgi:hypothetical protein